MSDKIIPLKLTDEGLIELDDISNKFTESQAAKKYKAGHDKIMLDCMRDQIIEMYLQEFTKPDKEYLRMLDKVRDDLFKVVEISEELMESYKPTMKTFTESG